MENLRSKNFVFTINNYTEDDEKIFEDARFKKQVKYYIYGYEIGEEGTKHLQGYIVFQNQKTFKQLKVYLPRAHLEKTKGNPEQNIAYCSKDGNFKEFGEAPQAGKRTDLSTIKTMVMEKKNTKEILPLIENFQQMKYYEGLMKYQPPPEPEKKTVLWYYGETGSGKTRQAMKQSGDDYYITMNNLKWWDGYYGQKTVIMDDFRKDFCTFHELLRILDRYPYRVQVKGSSVWLQSDTIIITSCYRPEEVYDTREDINQLLRRIDKIVEFKCV